MRPHGCSVHGVSQARTLAWVASSSCRGSSPPEDRARVPCVGKPAPGYSGDQPEKSPFLCGTRIERCWLDSILQWSYTFFKGLYYYYFHFGCAGSPFRRSGHPFLQSPGSGAQRRQLRLGLSCPVACGMLVPDQGLKLCPLRGKVDSQPLGHQGRLRHIHLMTTSYGGFPENSSGRIWCILGPHLGPALKAPWQGQPQTIPWA